MEKPENEHRKIQKCFLDSTTEQIATMLCGTDLKRNGLGPFRGKSNCISVSSQ